MASVSMHDVSRIRFFFGFLFTDICCGFMLSCQKTSVTGLSEKDSELVGFVTVTERVNIEYLKTRFGLEPVPRGESSNSQPCASDSVIEWRLSD